MKKSSVVALLAIAAAPALLAQQGPHSLDLAVTYNAGRSLEAGTVRSFWQQGGSAEVGATAWKGLGIAANITGLHSGSVGGGAVPISIVTATFGPRYRWHDNHKLAIYGQALLGVANAFNTLVPTNSGGDTSSNSMALQINGGIDLRLSHHFSARLLDAGWVRTYLPNATNNIQNNLRLGAGAVVHFGR